MRVALFGCVCLVVRVIVCCLYARLCVCLIVCVPVSVRVYARPFDCLCVACVCVVCMSD